MKAFSSLVVRLLDRLLPHKVIVNCAREPYLRRWYLLRTKPVAIFVHQFIRSDEDRALHDHPWPFVVIPIWRGYIEHSEIHRPLDPRRDTLRAGDEFAIPGSCSGEWYRLPWLSRGETFKADLIYRRAEKRRLRVWPLLGTRCRRATYRHRVELLPCSCESDNCDFNPCRRCGGRGFLPSWSLFIRFREWRVWGFHLPTGFMAWNQWWQEKCE